MTFGKVWKEGRSKFKYAYQVTKGKKFRRLLKWSVAAAAWLVVEDYEWRQRNQKWVLLSELLEYFSE